MSLHSPYKYIMSHELTITDIVIILSTNPNPTIFFLGAGASVHAGVPDTIGMVDEFR